ncbi:hypothetical protein K502DRAFT_368531 [Neoconidiobolus thromboides FSU 785]|nr:hypothetical protein K502DRAFT_368531 [Neoconidiobolus thromboides FSU 785]
MKFIQSIAALSFVLPFVVSLCPNPNSERCNKGNSGVYCYDGYSCPRCWTWNNGEWDCYDILADSKCTFSSWIDIDNPYNCHLMRYLNQTVILIFSSETKAI